MNGRSDGCTKLSVGSTNTWIVLSLARVESDGGPAASHGCIIIPTQRGVVQPGRSGVAVEYNLQTRKSIIPLDVDEHWRLRDFRNSSLLAT